MLMFFLGLCFYINIFPKLLRINVFKIPVYPFHDKREINHTGLVVIYCEAKRCSENECADQLRVAAQLIRTLVFAINYYIRFPS